MTETVIQVQDGGSLLGISVLEKLTHHKSLIKSYPLFYDFILCDYSCKKEK